MNERSKIIFLDIDGVLNPHDFNEVAQSSSICRGCVAHFNRLIEETGAKVVLSSAWRYMIYGSAMDFKGFEYLLRTHGVTSKLEIISVTCRDELLPAREEQVRHWLRVNAHRFPDPDFVILDDMAFGFREAGLPLVQTDSKTGLTAANAEEAIRLLTPPPPGG